MKYIKKRELYIKHNPLTEQFFTKDAIFFDIETTGFSPNTSTVYLIGCMYRDGQDLIISQFFAEDKSEEPKILEEFLTLLSNFTTIISFNGIGFDVPFLKSKCDRYGLKEHFKDFEYIDIFKLINNIKFLLKLTNYKQKTIESFLGVSREDRFSGGELINVYEQYITAPNPEGEALLLLHNFEDITGMLDLMPILSYQQILFGGFSVKSVELTPYTGYEGKESQELIICLENDYAVPTRVSCQHENFYIIMNKDVTKVRIPLYEGELKYFYPNYKDYFYLPKEDMAIHKSVANFVDKQYRERAKASNCYNRKSGRFLPQYDNIMNPGFKEEYKDKYSYFELTDDFLHSDVMLRRYVKHIFRICSSKCK